jgi:DNA-directed RNA polymerase specialized sigma24 family protein
LHANRLPQSANEYDENVFPPDTRALNPEQVLIQDGTVNLVCKAMEKLPTNIREILILREIEGMSYERLRTSPAFLSEPLYRRYRAREPACARL